MSHDAVRLSRRRVLAAVGAIGTAGAVGGVGTAAYVADRDRFTNALVAGTVAVDVDCASCSVDDGRVRFALDGIELGERRSERFSLRIAEDGNPVRLWLRTPCPPAVDPLGEALEVRLDVDDGCSEYAAGSPVEYDSGWTSLSALRTTLADGLRLDDPDAPCLAPGDVCCLRLRYRLPADERWAVAAESELALEFAAEQCRNVTESAVVDPFGPVRCPELDCPDCVELGTLEVADGRLVPGETYPLDDGDHELQVLSMTDRVDDDGDRKTVRAGFRLLRDGDEAAAPPMCEVAVGVDEPAETGRPDESGGRPANRGSRVVRSPVEPPLTRTRGEVPADDGTDTTDAERPAIASLTVSVCGGDEPEIEPDCVPCRDESGNRAREATLEYDGPDDDVAVDVEQQSQENAPQETVRTSGLSPGDSFVVPLAGAGSPDFEAIVERSDGTDATVGRFHTSCSSPFGPGLELSDGTYRLTVLEAVDAEGRRLCEVNTE